MIHNGSYFQRSLFWLRRDLRISDNTALARACLYSQEVIPVFIFDTRILDLLPDKDDRRMTFIHRSLVEVENQLRSLGSKLVVRIGDPAREIPYLAESLGAEAIFANRDYEPYAKVRDSIISAKLATGRRRLLLFKDHVLYEEDEITTRNGSPFKAFTPYKKAWLGRLHSDILYGPPPLHPHTPDPSRLAPASLLENFSSAWSLEKIGFKENTLIIRAGEKAAKERFESFLQNEIDLYDERRDFPAFNATSGLSVHLRFGTVSIRALAQAALERDSNGAAIWLSELIWREFYQMILACFPHVVDGAFRPEYNELRWNGKEEHLTAWREGRTGYPIVDAAMRHFNQTGWMHNRLRMIVASFLTKDLLIDWRKGEAHFARFLLDFDLAANNGGWQWSASTGNDAQPYFRIFNPVAQSRKFDPDGAFIRAHCPELGLFSDTDIHWPHSLSLSDQKSAGCIIGKDYPHPIVDHHEQRKIATELFRDARKKTSQESSSSEVFSKG